MFVIRPTILVYLPAIALLLIAISVEASDCGILKIQKNRSSGTVVMNNQCNANDELSLQSILKLPGNGRLWLETVSDTTENHWIICQNRSALPINILVQNPSSPWIVPAIEEHCEDWVNQRLGCYEAGTQSEILFCAITQINRVTDQPVMQRTSSLAIRGLSKYVTRNMDEQHPAIKKWKAALTPEIDLCRKAFRMNDSFALRWFINTAGSLTYTQVPEKVFDRQFIECAADAILHHGFPNLEKDTQITLTF